MPPEGGRGQTWTSVNKLCGPQLIKEIEEQPRQTDIFQNINFTLLFIVKQLDPLHKIIQVLQYI